MARVFPGVIKMPNYIAVKRYLFFNDILNNDEDIRLMLLHELQHVKDRFTDIRLAGFSITELYMQGQLSEKFYALVREIRARYEVVKEIFRNMSLGNKQPFSQQCISSLLYDYYVYLSSLEDYRGSSVEETIRRSQLNLLRNIKIEHISNGIKFSCNIFRRGDFLVLQER